MDLCIEIFSLAGKLIDCTLTFASFISGDMVWGPCGVSDVLSIAMLLVGLSTNPVCKPTPDI